MRSSPVRLLPPLLALAASVLAACEAPPRMRVAATTIATGDDVVVLLDDPLEGRAADQYWVALQDATAPASDTTGRVVLGRSDRRVLLRAARPGELEVRLHGRYPREEHHLLSRIAVTVQGWPVKTGAEPKVGLDECLDRWLAEQKLDRYGEPQGATYAGGTPLFDETSASGLTRWEHVVAKHPGLARTCDPPLGRTP